MRESCCKFLPYDKALGAVLYNQLVHLTKDSIQHLPDFPSIDSSRELVHCDERL